MGTTKLHPITQSCNFQTQWSFDHLPLDLTTISHIALAQCLIFNGSRAHDMGGFSWGQFSYVSASGTNRVPLIKYCPTPISGMMASKTISLPKSKPSLFIKHFLPAIFQLVTVKSLPTPIFTLFCSICIAESLKHLHLPNSYD